MAIAAFFVASALFFPVGIALVLITYLTIKSEIRNKSSFKIFYLLFFIPILSNLLGAISSNTRNFNSPECKDYFLATQDTFPRIYEIILSKQNFLFGEEIGLFSDFEKETESLDPVLQQCIQREYGE